MTSIYDMYMRDNIMTTCEKYFRDYLDREGVPEEHLTDSERDLIYIHIDAITSMITDIYNKAGDGGDPDSTVIDKLIGICVIGKMNEARLCRLLNMVTKKD